MMGIREVVGRRLSRLSEETNRALRIAAVIGSEFEVPVARAAGGFDEDVLLSSLDEAAAARLVIEVAGAPPRYRFSHALVRDTLYHELSAARRATQHRQVAEAIETLHAGRVDDHLPALAHHWARASAPLAETTRAVDYATRAGDRALVQLANDEAAAYYRQALELLEAAAAPRSDTRRLELLISLGEAQRRAGDGGYRETLLAAARLAQEHGDADALARAALANTRGSLMASFGSIDAERVAVLEAALTVVAGKGDPVEARLLAILGLELILSGDRERCRRLSDAALDLARRLDDPATLAHVLLARHHTIAGPDTLAERVANTAELVRACDRLGDPVATCQASYFQVRLAMEQGDVDEAGRVLDAWERVAVEIGQPVLRWNACWARGACVLFAGRVAEAEALATESLRLAEATGQPDVDVFRLYQLYGIRYEQDRLGELRQLLSDAITHNRGMAASVAALALLECELDEPDLARARLEAMGNLAGVRIDLTWPFNMACLAAVIAYLGDTARAETVYKALAPYPGRVAGVGTTWFGSVSHYLGLLATTLGRYDEAESHFAAAQSMHERIGAPAWLARSRLEWARMLLARSQTGDVQQARELLAKALATARQLGLAGIERLAVSLLHDES